MSSCWRGKCPIRVLWEPSREQANSFLRGLRRASGKGELSPHTLTLFYLRVLSTSGPKASGHLDQLPKEKGGSRQLIFFPPDTPRLLKDHF